MASNNTTSRAHSTSSGQDKADSNATAAPSREDSKQRKTSTTKANEGSNAVNGVMYTNGAGVPNWNGPEQDCSKTANGDPFTKSSAETNGGVKLSGRASTFNPNGGKPTPISLLNRKSEADDEPTMPVIVSSSKTPNSAAREDKGKGKAVQQPIGTRGENISPSRRRVYFTTDVGPDVVSPGGHYMKIMNVSVKELDACLQILHVQFGWTAKLRGSSVPSSTSETNHVVVLLNFNDTRDAATAFRDIEMVNPSWSVQYITQTEYASSRESNGNQESTLFHDGQVIFVAKFEGLSSDFTLDGLYDNIVDLATSFGELIGIMEMDVDAGNRQYRAEFHKVTVARGVIETLTTDHPATFGKWIIVAQELPDYTLQAAPKGVKPMNGTPQKLLDDNKALYTSPTGRSAWYVDENGVQRPTRGTRQLPKCQSIPVGVSLTPHPSHFRYSDPAPLTPVQYFNGGNIGPRSGSFEGPINHHGAMTMPPPRQHRQQYQEVDMSGAPNTVHRERIASGQDVRTTIMLRNLPNGMTVEILLELLNGTSKGKFDFVYLRIDFTKGRNVGYAFVNFEDALDILAFYDRFNGNFWIVTQRYRRYPDGSLPRTAEISYATVQGTDCAIEKFRNSSIMDEFPGFRPKLFYTFNTAPNPSMIGAERPFPGVNNESKHQRSRDNATQIGLYAPQTRRMQAGGRQRRSQYDRGTSAQIHEDTMYNQVSPTHNGYGYGPNYMLGGPQMPVGAQPQYQPVMMANMNGYDAYAQQYYNGSAVMTPHGYGPVQFTDPFNGGHLVSPGVPPSRLRTISNGCLGGGPRVTVHPGRTYETAVRQVAENAAITAAYDAGDFETVERLQREAEANEEADRRASNNASVPRPVDAEANEAENVVSYSAYDSNGHAGNGHAYYPQY